MINTKEKEQAFKNAYFNLSPHKRACFFCELKNSKRKEPLLHDSRIFSIFCFYCLAVVPEIPHQYPDEPKTTSCKNQYHVQNQSCCTSLFLTSTFSTHIIFVSFRLKTFMLFLNKRFLPYPKQMQILFGKTAKKTATAYV